MANKTWNKTKSVMAAGWCNVCKKEMLSDAGGWIVNACLLYTSPSPRDS